MKIAKYIIVVMACVPAWVGMRAESVSQKQAMQVAAAFFKEAFGESSSAPKLVWNGRQLTTDRLFSPFYIYNYPKGGYVIVAGENKAFPILGYSLSRKFERDKLSEAETELLRKYAHEIEFVRYDSRIPERAIKNWADIAATVRQMLSTPYSSDEYRALSADSKEALETLDRLGSQILLPQATEFYFYNPADYRPLTLDDLSAEADAEEIPFSFFETFVESLKKEKLQRDLEFEERLMPSEPQAGALGGGHFRIFFPEDMKLAKVYALSGMQVMEKYYKGISTMNIDLSALTPGYYILFALSDNGKIYGLKLYR